MKEAEPQLWRRCSARLDLSGGRSVPPWLQLDREGLKAKVISLPKREDVNFPIQEQMIVELYSK